MTPAFRRPLVTAAAAALRSRRAAFPDTVTCRRLSTNGLPSSSLRKCASSAEALLGDEVDAAVPKVEMVPLVIQRRVVVYDGVCHLCHTGNF